MRPTVRAEDQKSQARRRRRAASSQGSSILRCVSGRPVTSNS